jgi:hypothetical protein
MQLSIFYTKELPRRHALTVDPTGANLAKIRPRRAWNFWKTTTAIPGVSGYDPKGVMADIEAKGWSILRYNSDPKPGKPV